MTILSSGQFAYTINIVHNIFNDMAQKEMQFKDKKWKMSKFMMKRGIDSHLQVKVHKYLDYIQHRENEQPELGLEILNQVSSKIREKIFKNYYGGVLLNCQLFKRNFSQEFLLNLSLMMKESLYGPGEIIYNQEDEDTNMYFLIEGEVELFVENYEEKLTRINFFDKRGDFFGHRSFFSEKVRDTGARSLCTSLIYYFRREDFIQLIKKYQLDYEFFCNLRDNINIYETKFYEVCNACTQNKHSLLDCPRIHLKKNRDFWLKNYRRSIPTEDRTEFSRRNGKHHIFDQQNMKKVKKRLKKVRNKFVAELKKKFMKENSDCSDMSEVESSSGPESVTENSKSDDSFQSDKDDIFYKNNPGILFLEDGELIILDNEMNFSELSIDSQYLYTNNDQSQICCHDHDEEQNDQQIVSQKNIEFSHNNQHQNRQERIENSLQRKSRQMDNSNKSKVERQNNKYLTLPPSQMLKPFFQKDKVQVKKVEEKNIIPINIVPHVLADNDNNKHESPKFINPFIDNSQKSQIPQNSPRISTPGFMDMSIKRNFNRQQMKPQKEENLDDTLLRTLSDVDFQQGEKTIQQKSMQPPQTINIEPQIQNIQNNFNFENEMKKKSIDFPSHPIMHKEASQKSSVSRIITQNSKNPKKKSSSSRDSGSKKQLAQKLSKFAQHNKQQTIISPCPSQKHQKKNCQIRKNQGEVSQQGVLQLQPLQLVQNKDQMEEEEGILLSKFQVQEVQLFHYDMDQVKEFLKYFPHSNVSNVMKKFKQNYRHQRRQTMKQQQKEDLIKKINKNFANPPPPQVKIQVQKDNNNPPLSDNRISESIDTLKDNNMNFSSKIVQIKSLDEV